MEEEEGEEEEKRDGMPRKGKRGCIVMELRDASMAAETALAVLFPFAEVCVDAHTTALLVRKPIYIIFPCCSSPSIQTC